jgi:hypothetical protein
MAITLAIALFSGFALIIYVLLSCAISAYGSRMEKAKEALVFKFLPNPTCWRKEVSPKRGVYP